jgi:hypothetical protein
MALKIVIWMAEYAQGQSNIMIILKEKLPLKVIREACRVNEDYKLTKIGEHLIGLIYGIKSKHWKEDVSIVELKPLEKLDSKKELMRKKKAAMLLKMK